MSPVLQKIRRKVIGGAATGRVRESLPSRVRNNSPNERRDDVYVEKGGNQKKKHHPLQSVITFDKKLPLGSGPIYIYIRNKGTRDYAGNVCVCVAVVQCSDIPVRIETSVKIRGGYRCLEKSHTTTRDTTQQGAR